MAQNEVNIVVQGVLKMRENNVEKVLLKNHKNVYVLYLWSCK